MRLQSSVDTSTARCLECLGPLTDTDQGYYCAACGAMRRQAVTRLRSVLKQADAATWGRICERLTPREVAILERRFREGRTLASVATQYAVAGERIRQIEWKALRKVAVLLVPPEHLPVRWRAPWPWRTIEVCEVQPK